MEKASGVGAGGVAGAAAGGGVVGGAGWSSAAAAPAQVRPKDAAPAHMISFKFFIDYPLMISPPAHSGVAAQSPRRLGGRFLSSNAFAAANSRASGAGGRNARSDISCAPQHTFARFLGRRSDQAVRA